MIRALKWLGLSVGALVVLVIAATAGTYLYFAPRIDQYTARVEQMASARIGQPVAIGSLSMSWQGLGIEINLHDVSILNGSTGEPAISAAKVSVDLDVLDLLNWPRIHLSFVGVTGLQLHVVRHPDGRLTVAGLQTAKQEGTAFRFSDVQRLLKRFDRIAVHDATIVYSAPARGVESWRFKHVEFSISGGAQSPTIHLDTALPEAVGQGLRATITLAPTDARDTRWRWYARVHVKAFKLEALPRLLPRIPLDSRGGRVNVAFSGTGVGWDVASVEAHVRPTAANPVTATQLTADLHWDSGQGGRLRLYGRNMAIVLPDLFRGPIPLSRVALPLTFKQLKSGSWQIKSEHFTLANSQIAAEGHIKLRLPQDGSSPYIELKANARSIDLDHRSRYLPVGIMPDKVVAWIDRAVKNGIGRHTQVVFRGKVSNFPFRHGNGLFKVDFVLHDALIRFAHGWPSVKHLDAHIQFLNEGLSVKVSGGRIGGISVAGVTAAIPDLAQGQLNIAGNMQPSAASALAFLEASPLEQKVGSYVESIKARGPLGIDVKIELPLSHPQAARVHGSVKLHNVDVRFAGFERGLSSLEGTLLFSNDGLRSPDGLTGIFLGEPTTITLAPSEHGNAMRVTMATTTPVSTLASIVGPWLSDMASGRVAWRATATLPGGFQSTGGQPLTVKLRSDLEGLALDLPAPFGKSKNRMSTPA